MTTPSKKSHWKSIWRWLRYPVIGLVIIILIIAVQRIFFAADLSPLVKAQLAQVSALEATPSDGYTYMLGIDAPAGLDPMVRGRELLPMYVAYSKMGFQTPNDDKTPPEPEIQSIDFGPAVNCRMSVAECFATMVRASEARKKVLARYPEIIQRYQQFKTYKDYHRPYAYNVTNALSPYKVPSDAQRLFFLQQVDQVESLDPADRPAVVQRMQQAVLADLSYWRSVLASGGDLIQRMVVVRLIHNDLVVLGQIHVYYGLAAPHLPLLTLDERSMRSASAQETAFKVQFMKMHREAPCTWRNWGDCNFGLFGVLSDLNDTINLMAEDTEPQMKLATLTTVEAYRQRHVVVPPVAWSHWLRNPIGTLFGHDAYGSYREYVFRVDDINLRLTLLNVTANQPVGKSDPVWLASIQSPYGADAGHASINAQGWLCLPSAIPAREARPSIDGCIPWAQEQSVLSH